MLSALIRTARFFRTPRIATTWAAEFIDDRIITPRHRKHLGYYAERQLPVAEGIAQATGRDVALINGILVNLPEFLVADNKDPGMTIKWSATSELSATIYTLIKLLKPKKIELLPTQSLIFIAQVTRGFL